MHFLVRLIVRSVLDFFESFTFSVFIFNDIGASRGILATNPPSETELAVPPQTGQESF